MNGVQKEILCDLRPAVEVPGSQIGGVHTDAQNEAPNIVVLEENELQNDDEYSTSAVVLGEHEVWTDDEASDEHFEDVREPFSGFVTSKHDAFRESCKVRAMNTRVMFTFGDDAVCVGALSDSSGRKVALCNEAK